jgi:hypothetical protein
MGLVSIIGRAVISVATLGYIQQEQQQAQPNGGGAIDKNAMDALALKRRRQRAAMHAYGSALR